MIVDGKQAKLAVIRIILAFIRLKITDIPASDEIFRHHEEQRDGDADPGKRNHMKMVSRVCSRP